MHYVPFAPRDEPAATIYAALLEETKKRRGRALEQWIRQEREAVYRAAVGYAASSGLCVPNMEQVIAAERSAMGHVDYAAKWARGVSQAMANN